MERTRVFEIADKRGIRYNWIAQQMGYTPEYLSRIKGGTYPITEEFRRRACDLFSDVDPGLLFFDDDVDSSQHSLTKVAVAGD